jgi:maltose alpha-D-glucosyltransferase/alpha-amylase
MGRSIQTIEVIDAFELDGEVERSLAREELRLLFVRATFTDGEPSAYVLPVATMTEEAAESLLAEHPQAGILRVRRQGDEVTKMLCDATWDERLWQQLLAAVGYEWRLRGMNGTLSGFRTSAAADFIDESVFELHPAVHVGEKSNSSATFSEKLLLKLFRHISPGINPDVEIGRQLTEHEHFPHVPQVAGAIDYRNDSGKTTSIAVLQQFIPNAGDAWTYTLDELARYFERVQSRTSEPPAAVASSADASVPTTDPAFSLIDGGLDLSRRLLELADQEAPALAQETIGAYLFWAELLGKRLGELHLALAATDGGAAFLPEPYTRLYQRSLYQSMRNQARATFDSLRAALGKLGDEARELAQQVLDRQRDVLARFGELLLGPIQARRIRCHGHLHLGQLLFTGKDFVVIGFEGEPGRPVSERRIKASPLRDVAGILRSYHYATHAALRGESAALLISNLTPPAKRWAAHWCSWVSATFLRTYLVEVEKGRFLPSDRAQLDALLSAFLLEKALYEARSEVNNRPDWINVPLEGILQLLN